MNLILVVGGYPTNFYSCKNDLVFISIPNKHEELMCKYSKYAILFYYKISFKAIEEHVWMCFWLFLLLAIFILSVSGYVYFGVWEETNLYKVTLV